MDHHQRNILNVWEKSDGAALVRDGNDEVLGIPIKGWKFGVGDGEWKEDGTLMLTGKFFFTYLITHND